VRFDLLYEVGFRLSTYELVYYLTVLDEEDSGDAGDAIVDGKLGIVVHVDFTYIDLICIFFGQFLDDGSDCATGSTPFSPKVYYGQFIGRDDFLLEVGVS